MKKLLLTFILICSTILNAESKEYIHLSTKDGLHSDYITTLFRSDEGCMFIGTSEGLVRFDGVSTKQYTLLDADGNPTFGQASRIIGDSLCGGLLVMGKNLYKYNVANDEFDFVMQTEHILYSCLRAQGYYFCASDLGLVTQNIETGELLTFLKNEKVVNILEVGDEIYVLTPDNLYILYISNTTSGAAFEFNALSRANGKTFSAMETEDGVLYIGTKLEGLFSFDTRVKVMEHIDKLDITLVRALCVNNGMIYVNNENIGVLQYDIMQQRIVSYLGRDDKHPIANIPIFCLYVDNHDLLWVGSFSRGLYLVQPKNSSITLTPQTEDISIRSMWHISPKRSIIGSRTGLYLYNNGITKHFAMEEYSVMKSNIILSIRPYKGDTYIIGTFDGGAFLLDEPNQRIMPLDMGKRVSDEIGLKSVYGTEQVGDDIYFFTLQGLYKYSPNGGVECWHDQNSVMPSPLLFSHYYDKVRNVFWLGTKKGFSMFDIETQQVKEIVLIYEHNNAPMVNDFRSNTITMDSDNNILFDKDNIELMCYCPETKHINQIDYAPNSTGHISGIIDDSRHNNLLIATTNDLYSYSHDNKRSVRMMHYKEFPSTNICPNSIFTTPTGRVFVGTELGMYSFQMESNDDDVANQAIYISSLRINGEDRLEGCRYLDDNLRTRYNVNIDADELLEFEVVKLDFAKANGYLYAYQIDDGEWVYIESNTIKLKESLSIGSHELYVMVTSKDNISWSEPMYVGRIRVVPTKEMILVGVILLLVLLWIVRIFMVRVARSRVQELRQKVATPIGDERSKEVIEMIKDALRTTHGYRNPTYRIKDLAEESGLSAIEISQVLNNALNLSFTDFINDYRVEEVKEILLKSDASQYNLHVLAEQCGFNSKTSFYRIFKNKMGITPMQYRKQLLDDSSAEKQEE